MRANGSASSSSRSAFAPRPGSPWLTNFRRVCMSNRFGYRGYIASRPVRGLAQPQHVQNLVVRDYASRTKLPYLLSATEYAMPGCYMVLESVLAELAHVEGVI